MNFSKFNLNLMYARNPKILTSWMKIDRNTYLHHFSTSPLVEPPDFFLNSRAAMAQAYERYKMPCEYNGLEVQARVWKRQADGEWKLF